MISLADEWESPHYGAINYLLKLPGEFGVYSGQVNPFRYWIFDGQFKFVSAIYHIQIIVVISTDLEIRHRRKRNTSITNKFSDNKCIK